MTKWSVVKDDTKERRRPARYFRYGILASLAVLVLSLGLALIPGTPPEAPEPAFSEKARTAALAETMRLRQASSTLADAVSGAERQALLHTVTLLTTQARALIGPDQGPTPTATGTASGNPSATAPGTGAPSPAGGEAPTAGSAPELAAALSASSSRRFKDAEAADGGMARLLAAVGTAQLLQASSLATAVGAPGPELPAPAEPGSTPAAASPSPSESARSCPAAATSSGAAGGGATSESALAMTVKTEAETVYGYQVALARLDGSAAGSASQLLARHEAVLAEAEALSRADCASIPPREAGYTLGPLFLEKPAAGLGSLEAGTLPVYGDLVALSDGSTRQWAISGLLAAANRAALWGADSGPLPGIVVDTAQLPQLPEANPAPTSPNSAPSPNSAQSTGTGTAPAP
ncbi:DUF4439 domain-containing protein [Arthrobacter sp. 24S4-2]|uniref:ferritin-like domain-containing protein n=1 Tax=Arthrobacter sp. 24S4-2 TaxID=2575374 RepID=UPI0010C79A73|nr:ferritin-like domain-containing protein [Arthrobacter sp. 24S4-2]QCO97668.1 DUF4439 domain-containing protein [Arthrobacter sp. 24S4-2]